MNKPLSEVKILEQRETPVHPDFEGKITIHRIKYLVDGLAVVGFIVKPNNQEKQVLPVLLYNRGGNREYGKIDDERLYRLSSYAMHNYIVLASQYRGNDGGEGCEEFGGSDIQDIFALSELADQLPYADKNNKVMFGHSRGGLMTYICIKLGIDIKAAAVVGAPTDLLRRPLAFPMERILAELIGDPVRDREEYINRSAVHWPEKLRVPIIILHGDQDQRVTFEDAADLVDLLNEEGLEHKFILYKGGDHALSNYENERDKEIFDWFSRFLDL
jgi:dipeptidyl aminopeptidase/acylaminoacyl peptidase